MVPDNQWVAKECKNNLDNEPADTLSVVSTDSSAVKPYADYKINGVSDSDKIRREFKLDIDDSLVGGTYYIALKHNWLLASVEYVTPHPVPTPKRHILRKNYPHYTTVK